MSKKYEGLAQEIVAKVGGKENINNVYHCQTRLRFKLVDEQSVDQSAVEAIDGVAKVLINAGVFQVVIGTHVKDVYEEVEKLVDTNKEVVETKQKLGKGTAIIDFIAGTFQPIIPALSGAGMVKAVLAILVVFNVITTDSQTYYLLNLFADGVFFFLPMILAFTEAQKLKCNPILAVSVAAILMHPNWTALVSAQEPVNFFGIIPFTLATYTSSVIPIVIIVFVQSYVEKLLNRIIPKAVELVFVPMLTLLIMGTLALSVLGPIGSILGGYLAEFFTFLSETASWAPAVLIGTFCPLMVMVGLHNGVAPLGVVQMSNLGFDSIWGPGNICSNMAQAAATTVVAIRTRNKQTRQIATSASITAFMGITEPALYGVNLPKKYPLIATMIGGGLGGLYAGLTHTHRFATGSGGLPAVTLYIGDNTMQYFYNIIIAMTISIVASAVITLMLSMVYEKKEIEKNKNEVEEVKEIEEENIGKTVIDMNINSPLNGKLLSLSKAKDEAFASKALGNGVVIEPSIGKVVAPFDGKIATLFPTNHAIGIISPNGAEVLIHIGIDTVNLEGKCFEAKVKQGDYVKAGQELIEFNIKEIEEAGYSTQTIIVVTNTNDYSSVNAIDEGYVESMNNILTLKK